MAKFKVEWTGSYPCLCNGRWIIHRKGVDVSGFIPNDLQGGPMNTRRCYRYDTLDENFSEVSTFAYSGLSAKKWIRKNRYWIGKICESREEEFQLYYAIREQDWRYGMCGGCT